VEDAFMPIPQSIPSFDHHSPGEIASRLSLLIAEARAALTTNPGRADDALGRAADLLLASPTEPPQRALSGGLAPWQVLKVKAHVEARLAQDLTLASLAAIARMCPSHFARTFKTSFGQPVHAYVIARRIARARTLLLSTDSPLVEVAISCGFADQAHMTRLFRRLTGLTPGALRKDNRWPISA
jgi:AraC family transcriptional regulator